MAIGAVVFLSYLFMPVAVCSLYSESCNCVVVPVTRAGRSASDHSANLQVLLHNPSYSVRYQADLLRIYL